MTYLKPFFYIFISFTISAIAIAGYTAILLQQIDLYNGYELKTGIFIGSSLLLVFILICSWIVYMHGSLIWMRLLCFVLYLYFLSAVFFEIAYSQRIEFGTTWTNIEVWRKLVFYQWQTYGLIATSGLLYWWLNNWYSKEN